MAGVVPLARRASLRPTGPQVARELGAEHAAALHEERLIDRLMRHAHLQVRGEIANQSRSNLLRRPATAQATLHLEPQPATGAQLRGFGTARSLVRGQVCAPRTIAQRGSPSDQLTR